MNRFASSLDHLLAEAKRIDLMLRRRLIEIRAQRDVIPWNEFRGLYISEEEMDEFLSSAFPSQALHKPVQSDNALISKLNQSLQRLEAEISEQKANSLRNGIELRLELISEAFGLTRFEVDSLLIGLLPELDLRYQKLYAYLQDDVTKKAPTVNLILTILTSSLEDKSEARMAFLHGGGLLKHRLVSLYDNHSPNGASILEKALKVEQRVISYLLGPNEIDVQLSPCVQLVHPRVALSDVLLPPDTEPRLHSLIHGEVRPQGVILCFQGPYGAGKRMCAEAMCGELGMPLLIVDVARMLATDLPADSAMQLIFREASLQKACVYWDRSDLLFSTDNNAAAYHYGFFKELRNLPGIIFMSSQVDWQPPYRQLDIPLLKVELPVPTFNNRKQLWQKHLCDYTIQSPDIDVDALANKFHFTGGQIRDAVATARNLAFGRDSGNCVLNMDDLYQASRAQSGQKLNILARKIQPRFTWEDIVLPMDQMAQLREINNYVKYQHIVYGDWNFKQKSSLGRGLNVLFAGPSGTGKTMAAEIIADELGLDLYKIDLSTIVSKYIGETEKNLDRIFSEARDSNSILFFDEADALFGKRSEVRDSHDRYANIEISYLLQKMEEYDGIVILATNLQKNLDEAFARRMHFCVEFPFPQEADRLRIWQRIFPQEAPLSGDVDLSFMARQFKMTGGNIKNIAIAAAFMAAVNGGRINIEHLIRATKREYQKIGRLCTEADFAAYFDLVKS